MIERRPVVIETRFTCDLCGAHTAWARGTTEFVAEGWKTVRREDGVPIDVCARHDAVPAEMLASGPSAFEQQNDAAVWRQIQGTEETV